jgi:hypothetical protein
VIAAIALIVFINGGELKIRKGKFELDLCSEGLIGGLNEYFNSKQDKKIKEILMSKIKELKDTDNVVKTLAEINRENQNE